MSTEHDSVLDAVVHNALQSMQNETRDQASSQPRQQQADGGQPRRRNRAERRAHLQHSGGAGGQAGEGQKNEGQKDGQKKQARQGRSADARYAGSGDNAPRSRRRNSADGEKGRGSRYRGGKGDGRSGFAERSAGRRGSQWRDGNAHNAPEPTPFVLEEAFPVVEGTIGFADLSLDSRLLHALHDQGFTAPTPVQQQAVPAAYNAGEPQDVMVSSRTGSGKTVAFLLPVLQSMIERSADTAAAPAGKPRGSNRRRFTPARPQALVLCPTRELAQQVAQDAIAVLKYVRGVRVACVVGGVAYGRQLQALNQAAVVVATPGRLLDLHSNGQIEVEGVHHLVLDEADRMLDMGFADDLEAINSATQMREQTLMFSATFEPRIQKLARGMMREPVQLTLESAQQQHSNITQTLYWADTPGHKRKLLNHWMRDVSIEQAIVFAATKRECDKLAYYLQEEGFRAEALHGDMKQGQRNRTLRALRGGNIRFLVATDVAARGIDVPSITHVFNYGMPMKSEDYVHRIGRTGRAGRDGHAITFAVFDDRRKIRDIEKYTQQKIDVATIDGLEPEGSLEDFRGRGAGKGRGRAGGGGRGRNSAGGGGRDRHNKSGYAARKGNGGGRGRGSGGYRESPFAASDKRGGRGGQRRGR